MKTDEKARTPQAPNPDKDAPARPRPDDEREIEAEEIEMNRALREANRPIPGTLGGVLKP